MFDLGTSELLVVGAVALIVIGPKDLPEVFRQIGRFTAKARQMGREFSRAMEQAANETGVKDVASDLNKIANPKSMGVSAMKDAVDKFEKWDPMANAAKPTEAPSSASVTADEEEDFSGGAAATAAFEQAEADVAALAGTGSGHGPETQALIDKQAARKAVIDESSAKLKAIDAGEDGTKAAAKPRKGRAAATKTAAKAAAKPAAKPASKASAKTAATTTATKPAQKTATKTAKAVATKTASKPAARSKKSTSTTAKS